MPPRVSLDFVELRTGDRAGVVAWYARVVGLAVVLDDEAGDFTLLDAGGTRLAVRGGRPAQATGSAALMFRVDDLDGERARIVATGVESSEIKASAEGYRDFRLVDPDGRPVHIFAWATAPA
jgi:predicted enzyme related to lactoylglutathione lyase